MTAAIIITLSIVPTPAGCFRGIHRINTARLIRKVSTPILKPEALESPSARTVHGLIPAPAVIIK
jgi:hypothetical protein